MATLSTTFRQNILFGMLGLGGITPTGYLEIQDSSGTVLASFPAPWNVYTPTDLVNGVFTWPNALPQEVTASASGTAAKARLRIYKEGGGMEDIITDMTVGPSSTSEIQMADTNITAGQPVQLTSFSITAPADVIAG